MKLKKTKQSSNEPADSRRSTKRYIQRVVEEQEAQEEIDEYCTNERNPDRLDGLGLKRGQRR
jgi:hypothetical protein